MVGPPPAERRSRRDLGVPSLVSVVIPVRNGVDVIDEQLSALANQDYLGPFEVIVADNGSTDSLRGHLDDHPLADRIRLRWVDASGFPGAAYARNEGVRVAAGDFIAFCDADDRVYPEWLRELTAVAAYSEAVGGAVETHSLNSRLVQSWRPMLPSETPYEIPGYLRVPPTCSFGIWRQMFDKVGGFDTSYNRGAEDADLAIRIQLAGGVLGHAPKALVAYRLRDTLRGIWSQSVMCGEGHAHLYSDYRHYGMPRDKWYVTVDLVLYVLVRNPLLPTVLTRVPTGHWLFHAGNRLGRIRGSIRHRCFYA
ncbi:glycosyltransferase family 2 protein [Gordonia sp. (in: high G+C Gram-positive bacteria)]|jgi:glycosyltransferase involved in cell wall biosynthesis|uniref:glycosyltransferase n=2 Tax=Gordonia sp. (in: high G+C Gram-positive bacteria) TaxID=84139 RepID=UPI0025BA123E|nr:glycosyltransferase [Gordonia sp. (in: high G+C Gram-positive bacteria)]HQV17615.1 glycosyltransferase [Gordonia sp. (in: high G+C Gram-positive bacteria)]